MEVLAQKYADFELSIIRSVEVLDVQVPEFVRMVKDLKTPNEFCMAIDGFLARVSEAMSPGFEGKAQEIITIHTLLYSDEITPVLYNALCEPITRALVIQKSLALGWENLIDECLEKVLKDKISDEIQAKCSIFTYSLHLIKNWCEEVRSQIVAWNYKPGYFVEFLEKQASLALGDCLISKMFDIILDFPDTKPALSDLSDCIAKHPELKSTLETNTKIQLQKKIVHCSKATDGILLVYINLTKVMKILFPTMEVLESISDPIKKELRKRSDTFKCIIKTIAEDGELYALLDIKQKSVKEQDEFSSDEDELGAFEWQPIPRSALRNVISALNKRSDIVSMLINIYGSQEQFMEEYRIHLSKKLVSNTEFEVVTEIKDLEMLKKRFGEANLHKCEVMIQDVLSSKRINGFIHEHKSKDKFLKLGSLDFLIISSYFWPIEEQDYKFKLPEKIAESFQEYSEKYSVVKASRKLKFHEQLGSVTLTLEFDNGSKTWSGVSPLHAAIISLFDDEIGEKSSEELSNALGISQHQLRKEISFWETRGVISRIKRGEEFYYTASKNLP
ncbi:hypothetical protein SteCoe_33071 [Stentor coeruleus]|uniref:Cullin family profile domain-containing protein n=1 Tax=Stentor coeruleus TaxID=5963 RepID=A0A1R2AXM4_9CILI|nr:hypothetical protein SteCoe_33071 [Stentor coeruleus]